MSDSVENKVLGSLSDSLTHSLTRLKCSFKKKIIIRGKARELNHFYIEKEQKKGNFKMI